jgi:hypothetical protein
MPVPLHIATVPKRNASPGTRATFRRPVPLLSAQKEGRPSDELEVVASITNIINVNIDSAHLQTSLSAFFGRTHPHQAS